ncbi:PRKC apoptosis WT1 regulator protein [Pocillopora verrucosa]|uniref:PRKC apoptosis WT1 regulator protein n=1 Tax=Pocillopora verrucosa TaxID=203993 RepID=UPI0033409812
MADVSDESYAAETHRSKYKKDRTDRRERRGNRYGDVIDGSISPSKENKSPGLEDNGVANDLANSSADRDTGRRDRERRERRKPRDEEANVSVNDEASVEGATAASDETTPKKSLKKDRKSESAGHKRQAKRHLREKRRSTGVVMMPGGADADSEGDDDTKQVKANTQQNEQANDDEAIEDSPKSKGSNKRIEQKVQKDSETIQTQKLLEKIEDYESQLEDYKSELDKANKELETLRTENARLKDENSSLLRVISQISAMKPVK